MERRKLGNTGLEVSLLGFGGSHVGFRETPIETVREILAAALDAGLNVVDTAECYRDGEERIGQAVADRRSEFHLFTKVGHASGLEGEDWDPDMMRRSIERSLKRLRTDHVDLLQLHSCSKELLERGEVIQVLREAREKGQTRFIGYSGDGEAAKWAIESGEFDTLQTSLSLADQEPIELTLPLAVKRGMGVICKRPVANVAWTYAERPVGLYAEAYWDRLQELKYAALTQDDAASTALRFTAMQPGVSTMIVGTQKPGRWAQNAEALALGPLPAEVHDEIRARWKAVAKPDWTGRT